MISYFACYALVCHSFQQSDRFCHYAPAFDFCEEAKMRHKLGFDMLQSWQGRKATWCIWGAISLIFFGQKHIYPKRPNHIFLYGM